MLTTSSDPYYYFLGEISLDGINTTAAHPGGSAMEVETVAVSDGNMEESVPELTPEPLPTRYVKSS